ncbi:ABC transporter permease [Staphylococcus canis]|uniref:ABC transporter permease subunit n=1 Tax=Staphylococcus canis TaxID=2724942 RepID=A0ABS0T8I9_9STAP|nr:ABC transporter permease [Staphylococcus canis]MBI5975069.1 ABC transporter permease subunit [Staphylococcus canis]
MKQIIQAEMYKLSTKWLLISMIVVAIVSEVIACGLYFYNMHFSGVEVSANIYLGYAIAFYTPTLLVFIGILTAQLVSVEYENNMWSVLLVSERDRVQLFNAKFLVLTILTVLCTLVFAIIHLIASLLVTQSIPNLFEHIYIICAFIIGILGMVTIQFALAFIIENKVYIIGIGIVFAVLNLMMTSDAMPFKITEHITNVKQLIEYKEVLIFNITFWVYAIYSMIICLVVYGLARFYFKRKDL